MTTQCDYYQVKTDSLQVTSLTPLFRTNLQATCAAQVRISRSYFVASCPSANKYLVTILSVNEDGTVKRIYYTNEAVSERIELREQGDAYAAVLYEAVYSVQGKSLNFINSIEIIKPTQSNQLVTYRLLVT